MDQEAEGGLIIRRNMRVEGAGGLIGFVRHVVVDPETREVTHVVVRQHRDQRLLPVRQLIAAPGNSLRLRDEAEPEEALLPFERRDFRAVSPDEAQAQSRQAAVNGGVALLSARGDAVQVDGIVPQPAAAGTVAHDDASGVHTVMVDADHPYRLQLHEERLKLLKEMEQAGAVKISRVAVERIETVTVPIREERVIIERLRGGSGPVIVGDRELREGETTELTVATERVMVQKERVVLEDVTVRKEPVERIEAVQASLQKEVLQVDDPDELVVRPAAGGRAGGAR